MNEIYSFLSGSWCDHGSVRATCCQNKRKLIFPAWIGCCRKKDFNVRLSRWSWTQRDAFLLEPSALFLQPLSHVDLLVRPRLCSQAALQFRLLISSDIMVTSKRHGWWRKGGKSQEDSMVMSGNYLSNYITVGVCK